MAQDIQRTQPTAAELATQQKHERSKQLLQLVRDEDFMEQIEAALPPTVTKERFARAMATLVITNEDIGEATDRSIFLALVRCAQDGLLPDGREATIAVYNNSKTKRKEASYLPMVGGLVKLAGDYGWIVTPRVVYENDQFVHVEGLESRLDHVPAPVTARGKLFAVYAIGRRRGAPQDRQFVVLYEPEVAKRRAKAQTQKFWNDWPEQMWMKTAVKQLFKILSLDTYDERVQRILAVDDHSDAEALRKMYGPAAQHALAPAATPATPSGAAREASGDDRPRQGNDGEPDADGAGAEGVVARAAGHPDVDGSAHEDATNVPFGDDEPVLGAAAEGDGANAGSGTDPSANEPEPELATPPFGEAAKPSPELVAEAAKIAVPAEGVPAESPAAGKTLAEIAEIDGSERWFAWALARPAGHWDTDFELALQIFVSGHWPELLRAAAA